MGTTVTVLPLMRSPWILPHHLALFGFKIARGFVGHQAGEFFGERAKFACAAIGFAHQGEFMAHKGVVNNEQIHGFISFDGLKNGGDYSVFSGCFTAFNSWRRGGWSGV